MFNKLWRLVPGDHRSSGQGICPASLSLCLFAGIAAAIASSGHVTARPDLLMCFAGAWPDLL
jgi:hypothetical protein